MGVLRAHGSTQHDAAGYILRLLLLKMLSDTADGSSSSRGTRFVVPPSARWSRLLGISAVDLGDCINNACAVLEEVNPSLDRLLTKADFNSIELGRQVLHELVHTLSSLPPLREALVLNGHLGEAADAFLHRLAETSGRGVGLYYTPPSMARLLAELLAPSDGMRLYDPVCGVGGFLLESARWVASHTEMSLPRAAASLVLHGHERNAEQWALCRINLLLHGISDANVKLGDALWSPFTGAAGKLLEYDRILADPPWGAREWGAERAAEDAFGRFDPVPPAHGADYAFVQHCLASLSEQGMAALLMPRGVLFRGGGEEHIRGKLLQEDRFEAIIGLPRNILYETPIAPVVLILRRGKSTDRRGRVLFVDASHLGTTKARRRVLSRDDIHWVGRIFREFDGDKRYACAVPLDEIAKANWNLNVELYVKSDEASAPFDLEARLNAIAAVEAQREAAARHMDAAIGRLRRLYPFDS
ncbi:HsdM family class I SAM-dependent methyltransferase [Archangium primigenium]|uniref:HsdM family class I SAM-dependent methyltransferase n=1 Tax=[Archangium] primigenium TaxID=2792470 RepID=UPI003B84A0B7